MRIRSEHVRVLRASFHGTLYKDQGGHWRIACSKVRPSFRARRQLRSGGYLDNYHRITEKGLDALKSVGTLL